MPKLKTHSGAKKKVRRTKTGKIIRRHTSGNHFLQKKRAARKRRIVGTEQITGAQAKTISRQLGA